MSITTTKTVVVILLIIWMFTVFRSLLIMLCGAKIFKKASHGEKTAYYPIINLFTMLEVANVNTFFGVLLFVPVINIFILILMSYKLGKVFNTSTMFTIGLIVLPILFYPLLASNDKQYKLKDEAYFKAMDSARSESINLMTEEEIKSLNNSVVEDEVKVDSIFKSNAEIRAQENVGPYRATKIDILGLEKLKEASEEDNLLKPIERVEPNQNKVNQVQNTNTNKKDDVEMIEL